MKNKREFSMVYGFLIPALETVAAEVLAQPVDLSALLRRAGQRRPRKPFSDRSHGLPPSLTFTLHDCKYYGHVRWLMLMLVWAGWC